MKNCTEALDLTPSDTKALYRRAQAHEALEDMNNAFKDMATASRLDPSNKHMAKEANRLMNVFSKTMASRQTTEGVSKDMVDKVLGSSDIHTRRTALKNCVVLAREAHGANELIKTDAHVRFLPLLSDSDDDIRTHALYMYSAMVEGSPQRTAAIARLLHTQAQEQINAVLQSVSVPPAAASVAASAVSAVTMRATLQTYTPYDMHVCSSPSLFPLPSPPLSFPA